jgi:adenylate cyclase
VARGGDPCDMLDFAARETNIPELPITKIKQNASQPRALSAHLKIMSVPIEQRPPRSLRPPWLRYLDAAEYCAHRYTSVFVASNGGAAQTNTLDHQLTFLSPPPYSSHHVQSRNSLRGTLLRYLFEGYALDTDRRELHRGVEAVLISPQEFDLLDYLIRNSDRVVSKDDIIQAIWKGRAISDTALTTRLNAVRNAIGDSGQSQRLIKTFPRRGFRFVGEIRGQEKAASGNIADDRNQPSQPALTLPDKPSIAILPFSNLSSDPEQDYFADGIVDDIITALSRFKSVFVISRNSTFTYKGRAVDLKQVGRELGVRYVLEGSVRTAAKKVRITAQLIDATNGMHLWADRYQGELGDVFALQDEITVKVISSIQPKLLQIEIDQVARRPNDFSAYEHYLRANLRYYTMTRDGVAEAIHLLDRALEIDPRYSAAASLALLCHTLNLILGWSVDAQFDVKEATRLSQLVLSIDENDPETLACVGWAKIFIEGDAATAREMVDRAVALNPNSAIAWSYRGFVHVYAGLSEEALRSYEHAMRLSPLDPMQFGSLAMMSLAYIGLGRFDEAVIAARKSIGKHATFMPAHYCLASALAHLGREEEARQVTRQILQLQPDFRISKRRGRGSAAYLEGLQKAGLPE